MTPSTITVDGVDDLTELLELSAAEQWGDGLPIIPPTPERVKRALDAVALSPDHVLGTIPPSGAAATVQNVVVNAIMAGCSVAHLPVVFAATEAISHPRLNLLAIQVTTHPVGVAGFVSGPSLGRFGLNSGTNTFGPGNRANATIGRAIRLIMLNIGQGIPGSVDQATFGNPGKYGWFFGENQEQSPWAAWAERSGCGPSATTVAVFGAAGYLNLLETTSSADELLRVFAKSMSAPTSNDFLLRGEPMLVISPEHAQLLAEAGLGISDVQERIWRLARLRVDEFSDSAQRYRLPPAWGETLGNVTSDTKIPIAASPSDVRIVVSGGPGRHSVYVPGAGTSRLSQVALDPYIEVMRG